MNLVGHTEPVLFLRHPDGDWIVGWEKFSQTSQPAKDQPSFYLPDFFQDQENPWWVPEKFGRFSLPDLKKQFPQLDESSPEGATAPWTWTNPLKEEFEKDFYKIQGRIAEGQIRKAVPVVMARADRLPSPAEQWNWWRKTFSVPSRWIAYGGWWGNEGLVGLSPEILFYSQPGWTESMALAGTAPHPGPDLLQSQKDLLEHDWVVKDIQTQLSQFGAVKSTPTREWLLGALKHLRTDLAVAEKLRFHELVLALHPTPALGVSPRAAGLDILRESPWAKKRRRFGAPFGLHWPNEFDFACVAIRNLQWHEGATWLGSGCGVVKQSQCNAEWQELELKRSVVRSQFGVQ